MFSEDQSTDSLAEFSAWKWNHLQRRREFFVPQLAALNLFLWGYITVAVFNNSHLSVSTKGVVFTCAQGSGLLVLILLFSRRNKSMLKGNFGYRICILLGLTVFPLVYVLKQFTSTEIFFSRTNGAVMGSFVSAAWITTIHHIGLTEIFTWGTSIALMITWCFYVDSSDTMSDAPTNIAVVASCLVLSFCSSLLEVEYRNMYNQQNEAVERSLNDVTFIEDMAAVLRQVSRMLQRMGAEKSEPDLAHTEYLCCSLFGAATQSAVDDSGNLSTRSDVELAKLCAGAISRLESVRGRACTTYYDPSSAEVCINSKKYFLEQILLLLCDNTSPKNVPPPFCLFYFQSVNGNLHITIKRTSIETQSAANKRDVAQADTSEDSIDYMSEEAFLQTLVVEKSQRNGAYDNARFRLADRIARKHLKSKVDMTTPESQHGLLCTTLRLIIPGPVSMSNISRSEGEGALDLSMVHLNPWYVVEYYKFNEDKLANIKYQLDILSVPWKSVHAYHFSNMKAKTQIAVVHDIWFRSHKEKVFEEVYSLARAVILVSSDSDAPKTFQYSPDDGPARVIKVSATISTRDLFNAIQSLIGKMKPFNYPRSERIRGRESKRPTFHQQFSDVNLNPGASVDVSRVGTLRTVNSLEIAPTNSNRKEGDSLSKHGRQSFGSAGLLPLFMESEEDADHMFEDSILQIRIRNSQPSGARSRTGSYEPAEAGDDAESNAGSLNTFANLLVPPEDSSFSVLKEKWTLLLDRLEFEVSVNKASGDPVRALNMDDDTDECLPQKLKLKSISTLYKAAMERIDSSSMGSYDVIAKSFVDTLRKQRTTKGKLWIFACLPYPQRIAKLFSDEFMIPLGEARRMLRDGRCDEIMDIMATLGGKSENMSMQPLPAYFAVTVDVIKVLIEDYPGSEGIMPPGPGGDIPFISISRPSTARVHGSNDTTSTLPLSSRKEPSTNSPAAFRSSANGLLAEEAVSQNMEIRKILLNMFDLIEVNMWTILANVLRLCEEEMV